MKVKICGLKYAGNITALLALSPDLIGFVFYPPSPRYVGGQPRLAGFSREIGHVKKAGVFVDEDPAIVRERVAEYGLDMVQLHGSETPDYCEQIPEQVQVIKTFMLTPDFDFGILYRYREVCRWFLFDTPAAQCGGSGRPFDWRLLQYRNIPLPFFLAGGIGPQNYRAALGIQHEMLIGLDVNSCFEYWPGYKDIHTIKSFLHEIRNR